MYKRNGIVADDLMVDSQVQCDETPKTVCYILGIYFMLTNIKNNSVELKLYEHGQNGPVIIYISSRDFSGQTEQLFNRLKSGEIRNFLLAELIVREWDRFLTPWPVHDCIKNRNFTGEGQKLLEQISSDVLPFLLKRYPNHGNVYIAGYSLAGLFSLWCLYKNSCLSGAISASGSLWYPGWFDYCKEQKWADSRQAKIYMSLGDKEANNRNPYMSRVMEITELQFQVFEKYAGITDLILKTECGGHFDKIMERMENGMKWILKADMQKDK